MNDVDWDVVKERREAYVEACNAFKKIDAVYNETQIERQIKHKKMNAAMAAINEVLLPEFNKEEETKGSDAAEALKKKLFGENPTDE